MNSRKAFSLIEIAVAILIIGLLIAGISKGADLYQDFKIATARNLTLNSRVGRIDGLTLWLETSDVNNLKSSLVENINSTKFGNIKNNYPISEWRDRSSNNINKISTLASNDAKRPTYLSEGIGGLPSLYFNGSQTLSSFNTPLQAKQGVYTIIGVFNSYLTIGAHYIFSQTDLASTSPKNGRQASIYIHAPPAGLGITLNAGSGAYQASATYVDKKEYITAIRLDTSLAENNVSVYVNSLTPTVSSYANSIDLSNEVFSVGARSDGYLYYIGLISEAIIFNRALSDNEINEVIGYLSKKYNIKLN